jgi:hypothetical protein
VNGRAYEIDRLREALREGMSAKDPLELGVENADVLKTYKINYHGGEKFPHLERDSSRPDLLQQIIKPHAK